MTLNVSRMRLRVLLPLVLPALVLVLSAQAPPPAASRTARSDEWEISDWSAIRAGQLSLVHGRQGDQLEVNALTMRVAAAAPAADRGAVPACDGDCFVVSSFDYSRNRLGGYFGTFASGGSAARASLERWEDGRRALTLDFTATASGPCGTWIHLFDSARAPADRVYLDAGPLRALTFWVRGRTGAEKILLKAADAVWERREDALPVGDLASFLPAGRVTDAWQQAIVPLAALPARLDRHALALIAFEAVPPVDARIAVKDLAFCLRPRPAVPLSPPVPPASGVRGNRALWVWNTAEIISRPAERQALVDFARQHQVAHLFLQLPDSQAQRGPSGEIVLDASTWSDFLGLLNRSGLRPYALAGSPQDAVPEQHARVLGTVRNVAAYNAGAAPAERFAGIHLDIEPYLLHGFRGPRRQAILAGYLDLVAHVAARARAAGLEFGVDIPFWYDSPDDLTGEVALVAYRGARLPASRHILDLVDSVAIMTYRTVASGADSIAALADGELADAAAKGKRVFIGLETTELPDEQVIDFEGEPRRGLSGEAALVPRVVLEPGPAGATIRFVQAADQYVTARAGDPGPPANSLLWWPVRRAVAVPASKLTFARLGVARLDETIERALAELGDRPAFAGFAIHDYIGYRALIAGSHPPGS